jgi:hypothetical protein
MAGRERAVEVGTKFYELIKIAAHLDPVQAAREVVNSLNDWLPEDDDDEGSLRIWQLTHAGPVMMAALIRDVLGNPTLDADEFWGLDEPDAGALSALDPHDRAVMQCINSALNDDHGATGSIISAHRATHGEEGVIEMLMCMIKHGAEFVRLHEKHSHA